MHKHFLQLDTSTTTDYLMNFVCECGAQCRVIRQWYKDQVTRA